MDNRSLIYMTIIVVIGILILLFINLSDVFRGKPSEETYIKYNSVRGSAIEYKGKLYTLNFDQQNNLIQAINRSVRIVELPNGELVKPEFSKIIFYHFNAPDLTITPIAYTNENLIFAAPQLVKSDYLMELSRGELQKLLSQTYDH